MEYNSKELTDSIYKLNDTLERKLEIWRIFLNAVISGIGTAVGAALIGAIVVGVIASNLDRVPILRDILPDNIEKYIEESSND